MDFIWTRGNRAVGIEVKASSSWRGEFGGALKVLLEQRIIKRGFGVYTGTAELKDGALTVLPMKKFFKELTDGNALG